MRRGHAPARTSSRQPPAVAPGARRAAFSFLARFVAGWAVVLLAAAILPGIERRAIATTVASVAGTLRAAALHVQVGGASIVVGRAPIEITPDCTSLMPTAALWVAILAFPGAASWKLAGALAGGAALWLYNMARILTMILVLNVRPGWFEFVHVYLWQTMTLVVVVGLFLLWLRLEPRPAPA
jgi:exosortase/archaeosortase family protein